MTVLGHFQTFLSGRKRVRYAPESIGNRAQTFTNVEFPLASSLEAINKGDQDDLLCSTGRWRSKIGSLHCR